LRLKSELKWLNGYLGATRDLDVAIENCQDTAEKRVFKSARMETQRRLKRALESARYRRWFSDLSDWVGNGPWSAKQDECSIRDRECPTSQYHARKLARWYSKLVRKSRGLQGMGKHKRHRLRLASKRLRYAIEFSEGALPKHDFSQWRNTMKDLRKTQQILGELNDAEMRRSLAESLARSRVTASTGDPQDLKPLDRKQKGRLLRRAAVVYRRIAG
jgi:CHAD domain-containing protein